MSAPAMRPPHARPPSAEPAHPAHALLGGTRSHAHPTPACARAQEERASFGKQFIDSGFVDVFRKQYPDTAAFTYFSWRWVSQ